MTEEESTIGSLSMSEVNTASRRKSTSSWAIGGELMIRGSKFNGTADGNRTIIDGIYCRGLFGSEIFTTTVVRFACCTHCWRI
jgi:hypothetical protein